MYQRQKRKKRQQDIKEKLENFKGVSNIRGIKSAKKEVHITKVKNSRLEKGFPMSLEISTNNFTTTMSKKNLNKKLERMKLRAASMCPTTTPMRRRESQRSRQKSCATAMNKFNQGKSPDSNGFEQKTSKLVTRIRKKW